MLANMPAPLLWYSPVKVRSLNQLHHMHKQTAQMFLLLCLCPEVSNDAAYWALKQISLQWPLVAHIAFNLITLLALKQISMQSAPTLDKIYQKNIDYKI